MVRGGLQAVTVNMRVYGEGGGLARLPNWVTLYRCRGIGVWGDYTSVALLEGVGAWPVTFGTTLR